MMKGSCFALLLLVAAPCFGQVSGTLQLHVVDSEVFGNTRLLRVWLPASYDADTTKQYPVLYLNDGQNLFDATTSTFSDQAWNVDETLTRLVANGKVAPLIVVGIDHGGRRRRPVEYLPFPDQSLVPPVPDPKGKEYPEFLGEDVIPFIEARYRTKSGPGDRILGGSSYGALVSLYTVSVRPDLAHSLLLESPSLYVDGRRVFSALQASETPFRKVYIGIGTNELGRPDCDERHPGNQEAVADAKRLHALFREKGLEEDNLLLVLDACATHNEQAWASRFDRAIQFLSH